MSTNKRIENWKKEAEELRVQAHLGKMEAEKAFDSKKKELKTWLSDLKAKTENLENKGSEKWDAVKSDIESLQVQLALGRAEGKEAILEQEKKIATKSSELKAKLNGLIKESSSQSQELIEDASERLEQFQMKFDLFRLQFQLGLKEGKDFWEEKQKDFSKGIHEFNNKLESLEKAGEKKWSNFKSEITEAWDHVKKAF